LYIGIDTFMIYDLIILGGGPGGVAAGVYAARKRLKTLVIAKEIGGQSIVSDNIQNWIGTVSIPGPKLQKSLKEHLLAYADDVLTLKEKEWINKLEKSGDGFAVTTDKDRYESKAVLITTGSSRKKLTAKGAKEFENKGVVYCASCDGPLFADMDVVVVGGGNAGFETAAQLLAYCKSVTLLEYGNAFKADKITVDKVTANPKMKALLNVEIKEIKGEKFVNGITYQDKNSGETKELSVSGVFVEIGAIPGTEYVKGLVEVDKIGQVVVNPRNQRARLLTPPEIASDARRGESDTRSVGESTMSAAPRLRNEADEVISGGVWAAGDCTDGLYHQNNIAMGDAVKALEDIYMWLTQK